MSVLLCLQAAEDMGLPEVFLEEKLRSYVANIDMVEFQKAACVKSQWIELVEHIFYIFICT